MLRPSSSSRSFACCEVRSSTEEKSILQSMNLLDAFPIRSDMRTNQSAWHADLEVPGIEWKTEQCEESEAGFCATHILAREFMYPPKQECLTPLTMGSGIEFWLTTFD